MHKEKFSGCLVGQALGDALGFNVEGYKPDLAQKYVTGIMQAGKAAQFGRKPYDFGQYTDDTQLARELAISLIEKGGFDPTHYATRIAILFEKKAAISPPEATAQAAQRLLDGVPWEKTGSPPPAADSGSAMRAAPIGLIYHGDRTRELVNAAYEQSRITHQDGRCSAGATVVAGAVSIVLTGESLEPRRFVDQLAEWAMSHSMTFAEGIQRLPTWLEMPPTLAGRSISEFCLRAEEIGDPWEGIPLFVVSGVLWALYSFLKNPDDYWQTIATALSAGGNADTTAAMAGAISGAYNGLGGIPKDLTAHLTDQGQWGYPQLVALGEKLHEKATA
ncbi:MAG: ADP-ribosylglycohydrolase family protein [Anaerolineae bacterium]